MKLREAVERYKNKDPNAGQFIYEQLSGKMFGVCLRYAENKAEAEDILHDGFVLLFSKIEDYRDEGSFEGWARRIFVTIALSKIRRKKNYLKESDLNEAQHIATNVPEVIGNMEANEIINFINNLPPRYRAILNMYSIEGYSHKEIAQELGISTDSSRVGLKRAKAMLSKMLNEAQII